MLLKNLPSTIHTSLHFCYDYCSPQTSTCHLAYADGSCKFKVVWIFHHWSHRRTRTPSIVCQAGDRRGPYDPIAIIQMETEVFPSLQLMVSVIGLSFLPMPLSVEINLFLFFFFSPWILCIAYSQQVSYIFITLLYIFCLKKEILTLRPLVPKHNDNYKVNRERG